MNNKLESRKGQAIHKEELEIEIVDFSDLQQLEESIAPIFLLGAAAGGKCDGGAGSGCVCTVPT